MEPTAFVFPQPLSLRDSAYRPSKGSGPEVDMTTENGIEIINNAYKTECNAICASHQYADNHATPPTAEDLAARAKHAVVVAKGIFAIVNR